MENDFKNSEKYDDIYRKIESLFRRKGLRKTDYISKETFPLKDDIQFHNLLNSSFLSSSSKSKQSQLPPNKVLFILTELNQSSSFKDLKVRVEPFISRISKILTDASVSIDISNETISKNDSQKKIGKIDQALKILGAKIESKKRGEFSSTFYAKILSIENFPKDTYNAKLKINSDFDKEDIKELNESEKRNMNPKLTDCVFNLFTETTLMTKGIISIQNENVKTNFLNNGLNNNNNDNMFFEEYKFSMLEKTSNNYLVDKRYSGTTFSCYKICLKGTNYYESQNEYMIHFFSNCLDEICDLNTNIITKNLNMNLIGKQDKNNEKRNVLLQVEVELDSLAKFGVLNRLKELISIPLDIKVKNQVIINDILDYYFKEIKEEVMKIINKPEEEIREDCCAGDKCKIF